MAQAFADDKQLHLDFYQTGNNFPAAPNFRARRDALKATDHHASMPLPVHASDLALKDAFETEAKYWAAIAADVRPRIGARAWTDEQKHYAFWLLHDEQRFSALILERAPVNDTLDLTPAERIQVQSYLRRRARKMMGRRPRVRTARSFVLDNSLYTVVQTLTGQGLSISSLDKGNRIRIPLKGEGDIGGNIRIVLLPETRQVQVHVGFDLVAPASATTEVAAVDAGITEVFVDDAGRHYGAELGETLKIASRELATKGRRRNKLHALARKYAAQGKKAKARRIRRYNLGRKKQVALTQRTKTTIANQVNRATNELLKERKPGVIVTERLDLRGPAQSKDISRRVTHWRRKTLNERIEFKASAAGCRREQVNPAYTSQTCPNCGYPERTNRKGDAFQCVKCEHRGQADEIAAINLKQRHFDPRITLWTPKETVKVILLKDYQARLEQRNDAPAGADGTLTVPGSTLERDLRATGSSRQSKSETAAGKSTTSAALK
jgi:IS605 OrfB family transposase